MALDQETIRKATEFQKQSEEAESQLDFIQKQIIELETFSLSLKTLIESKEKSAISSLGKGVYLKTDITDKKLLVEVGAGILVRKTPEQTLLVIKEQVSRLNEMKVALLSQLEGYRQEFNTILANMRAAQMGSTEDPEED